MKGKQNSCCFMIKGSVDLLAIKRSAGVVTEVNLRNSIAYRRQSMQVIVSTLALKPRADVTRSLKHMSHFAYACKMRCPLNLVLENWENLHFY